MLHNLFYSSKIIAVTILLQQENYGWNYNNYSKETMDTMVHFCREKHDIPSPVGPKSLISHVTTGHVLINK